MAASERRILIVEDKHTDRDMLLRLMGRYGTCEAACDGQEGMDLLLESVQTGAFYDLLCLDLMLPHLDGLHIISMVRAWERQKQLNRRLPILVVSAITYRDVIDRSFELGGDAYAAKPLSEEKIAEAMGSLGIAVSASS